MLFAGAAFAIVAGIIFGAYWLFVLRPEQRHQSGLRARLKPELQAIQKRIGLVRAPDAMSHIGILNRLLTKYSDAFRPIKKSLDDADLPITLSVLFLLCAMSGLLTAFAVNMYVGIWWLALASGAAMLLLPIVIVRVAKTRRVRQFEEQFPEAIDLIARALRAGHAFATGIQMAADEMPKPAGPEFRLLYERQNYGAQLPDALRNFADRVPSLDARFFVTAVLTQREAGGNLSEVLDRLAAVMRDRFRIKREVGVKSAHGRITALVLAALPPVLAGLMFMNNPEEMKVMVTDPMGIRMLIAGGVLEVIGIFVIRRLVDIEY